MFVRRGVTQLPHHKLCCCRLQYIKHTESAGTSTWSVRSMLPQNERNLICFLQAVGHSIIHRRMIRIYVFFFLDNGCLWEWCRRYNKGERRPWWRWRSALDCRKWMTCSACWPGDRRQTKGWINEFPEELPEILSSALFTILSSACNP